MISVPEERARGRFRFGRGKGCRWDLLLLVVAADRVSELLEPLTKGATGVRQSPRPEEHKGNDQNDE